MGVVGTGPVGQPGAARARSRVIPCWASWAQGALAARWSRTRRPVRARVAGTVNRRGRNRLGSHRRAGWSVRASISRPGGDLHGQGHDRAPDLILGEVEQGECAQSGGGTSRRPGAGGAFAMRIRSSQRARRRWRISRSGSWVPGPPVGVLVANAVMRWPSTSGDGQLRAGVGAFFADDHAHALGPVRQVQQVGELGDPRAVADLVVGVQRGSPHLGGMRSSRSDVLDGRENPTE